MSTNKAFTFILTTALCLSPGLVHGRDFGGAKDTEWHSGSKASSLIAANQNEHQNASDLIATGQGELSNAGNLTATSQNEQSNASSLTVAGQGEQSNAGSIVAGQSETPDDNQDKIYSLRDCMEYAVSNSTQMRIQQANVDDYRVERRNAILEAFTPSISAGSYAYNNYGRTVDPETNTYTNLTSFNNGYSASASIYLFNGFEAVNNIKINKTAYAMGLSEEERIKNNICLSIMEAYCNVVYYARLVEILDEQVQTARESLRVTELQEELGQKGYADVVEMRAELADKEYEKITANNSLEDAIITLKDLMFWPIDEELRIDLDFGENAFIGDSLLLSPEDIIANAKASLPELKVAKGTMDNAALSLRTAKWQLAPTLSLYAGWSTSYYTYPGQDYYTEPFRTQFINNGGEYIQLSLSIPIYSRLSRQSNIRKARNAYKRAEAEYEQKVREVEAEVMRAIQDRDGAEAAYRQAEQRAAVQEEAFRLNARKHEQGLISTIEYRTASSTYLNAVAEEINKLLQYNIKKAVVAYYNGIPYLDQKL